VRQVRPSGPRRSKGLQRRPWGPLAPCVGAELFYTEMERRGGTVSGIDSLLWAKDSSSIPVLISGSLLFDDDGRQIGTVGFATDLRERKRR
jgi:hypothetical protein